MAQLMARLERRCRTRTASRRRTRSVTTSDPTVCRDVALYVYSLLSSMSGVTDCSVSSDRFNGTRQRSRHAESRRAVRGWPVRLFTGVRAQLLYTDLRHLCQFLALGRLCVSFDCSQSRSVDHKGRKEHEGNHAGGDSAAGGSGRCRERSVMSRSRDEG